MSELEDHVVDDEDLHDDDKAVSPVVQAITWLLALPLLIILFALAVALIAAIVGSFILLGWAIYHSDPGQITPGVDAGYVELIVSNRWVVWGLRAALLCLVPVILILSLFVVMSIVVRARRREWLRSGAGLHTDIHEAGTAIARADSTLVRLLHEAQSEKDELSEKLTQTTDLLDFVIDEQEALRARLAQYEEDPS